VDIFSGCKSCLDGMKAIESVINNICPMCRDKDFVTFPNKQIYREVKSLHVYCTNKGRGCKWQGEVNYISNHLTKGGGWEYEDVLRTSGIIQQRDLTKHVETECRELPVLPTWRRTSVYRGET